MGKERGFRDARAVFVAMAIGATTEESGTPCKGSRRPAGQPASPFFVEGSAHKGGDHLGGLVCAVPKRGQSAPKRAGADQKELETSRKSPPKCSDCSSQSGI